MLKTEIQNHLESMRRAKISETMKEVKSANKNAQKMNYENDI